ncbi:MAG: hypothetical protein ACRDMV_14740 [Streptosporangiales bacterium]
MHEVHITSEVWAFDCERCGHRWTETYELHATPDFGGGEFSTWHRRGLPCLSPAAGMPCPECAGLRVKQHPRHSATPFWPVDTAS